MMKTSNGMLMVLALVAMVAGGVMAAETVHQTVSGDNLRSGDGTNAVSKGEMETKKVDGAQTGQVARLNGQTPQWGFVTAWFGLPAPQGKCIVRVRVYVEAEKTARYMLYTRSSEGQTPVGELKIPADAKENTFVTVDVPVDAKAEWSGLTIKKAEKSELPSPWIDTVSIVLTQ